MRDVRELLLVTWLDAYGSGGAWETAGDVGAKALVCTTVGFWHDEDEDTLCMIQTYHEDGVYNSMCIPKSMIRSRTTVSGGSDEEEASSRAEVDLE